jgi:hypothetical protein
LRGRQACREFLAVDVKALIPPSLRSATSEALTRQHLLEGAASSSCQPRAGLTITRKASYSPASTSAQPYLEAIEVALSSASSPSHFASLLVPIVSSANAQLVSPDVDIVGASASVALSSYEYWTANLGGFISDLGNRYSPCVREASYWEQCMGSLDAQGPRRKPSGLNLVPLATVSPCNYTAGGVKVLGHADLKGAIGGAIGGALTGGPQGAVLGALGGALAASVAAAIPIGLQQFWCDLHQ